MKIMTGTVLFTLLMMPAAVIADVTHKVSGTVTITKHQEGDEYKVQWRRKCEQANANTCLTVSEITLEVQDNGTVPFELTCEQPKSSGIICEEHNSIGFPNDNELVVIHQHKGGGLTHHEPYKIEF